MENIPEHVTLHSETSLFETQQPVDTNRVWERPSDPSLSSQPQSLTADGCPSLLLEVSSS